MTMLLLRSCRGSPSFTFIVAFLCTMVSCALSNVAHLVHGNIVYVDAAHKSRDRWDKFRVPYRRMYESCESWCNAFSSDIDKVCEEKKSTYRKLSSEVSDWISNEVSSEKKKEINQYSAAIAAIIEESGRYLSDDVEWDLMGTNKKVTVWKLKKSSLKMKKEDSDWPCVKASTIIEVDSQTLVEYLTDSSKVKEYNRYCAGRSDIEHLSADTTIVWNRMNIPIGIKPYDFCTLIHRYSKPANKEIYFISKCVKHLLVPEHKDYGRSEKIMGINILRSLKADTKNGRPTSTEIICISHQRYANTPPIMIEKSMMRGKMNYLRKLRDVHEKRP